MVLGIQLGTAAAVGASNALVRGHFAQLLFVTSPDWVLPPVPLVRQSAGYLCSARSRYGDDPTVPNGAGTVPTRIWMCPPRRAAL